jgi:hypothetical protein
MCSLDLSSSPTETSSRSADSRKPFAKAGPVRHSHVFVVHFLHGVHHPADSASPDPPRASTLMPCQASSLGSPGLGFRPAQDKPRVEPRPFGRRSADSSRVGAEFTNMVVRLMRL